MSLFVKILLWVIVLGVVAGGYVAGSDRVREILEERLSQELKIQVKINVLLLTPHPGVSIKKLTLSRPEGFGSLESLSIDRLKIRFSMISILKSNPSYRLSGQFLDSTGQPVGELQAQGACLSNGMKQMELHLKHKIVPALEPYLKSVLGVAPASGEVKLTSQITFADWLLTVENELTASDLIFPTDEPTVLGPPGNRLFEVLKGPDGQARLHFLVEGRVWEGLSWITLMSEALKGALSQALAQSIQETLTQTEQGQSAEELLRRGFESLGR